MTTATQRAKIVTPVLGASIHRYRVMVGKDIIGQFSNLKLAAETAHEHRGVVLDMTKSPSAVVYRHGEMLGKLEGK